MSSRASPRARRMVHLHVVSDLGISIDAGIPPRSANHSPRPSPRGLVWRASGPRPEQPSCPARGRRGRASRRVARPSLTVTMRTWSCLAGSLTRRCPYPYPHVLVFWVCVCVFNFLKIKFNFLKNFFFKLSFFFFPEWVQIPREVEITPRGPPHSHPARPITNISYHELLLMRYFYLKATLCSDFLSVTFKNRLRPFGSLRAHYPTVHQHLTRATSSHGKRRGPHAPGLSPAEKPRSGARGRAGKGGGRRGSNPEPRAPRLTGRDAFAPCTENKI